MRVALWHNYSFSLGSTSRHAHGQVRALFSISKISSHGWRAGGFSYELGPSYIHGDLGSLVRRTTVETNIHYAFICHRFFIIITILLGVPESDDGKMGRGWQTFGDSEELAPNIQLIFFVWFPSM